MEDFLTIVHPLVLLGIVLFVWAVIRSAVSHGMRDAFRWQARHSGPRK